MSENRFQYSVEPWSMVRESMEYETPIFDLYKRRLRLESEGLEGIFYVLDMPAWVNVIALTPEREVVLVEQYRFGIEQPSLEIPGGVSDPDEPPMETARRELMEETGYRAEKWTDLGKVSANPAIQNNVNYCFLAEGCRPAGATSFDRHERIVVHTLPYEAFLERVRNGTIDHAIVVAAVAKLLLREK